MINFLGFNEKYLTFKITATVTDGTPVKMLENQTVAAATDSTEFFGIAENCRNGSVAVKMSGYAKVSYSGVAPLVGYCQVCSNGIGGIKTGEGKKVLVTDIDTSASVCGIIF